VLVAFRKERPELRQAHYLGAGQIEWHGTLAGKPDWSETSRLVAFSLSGPTGGLYIAFNSHHLPTTVQLPDWYGNQWRLLVDTGKVGTPPMCLFLFLYKQIGLIWLTFLYQRVSNVTYETLDPHRILARCRTENVYQLACF